LQSLPPVITIDGLSSTGKGTVCRLLAKKLGWHFLDSGALYRAVGWAVLHYEIDFHDDQAIEQMLQKLNVRMQSDLDPVQVICNGQDISSAIREEACGMMASRVAAKGFVRNALLQLQRDMRVEPGLIADGRDMGTVIFPDAPLKFYFQADPQERARRRYNQLKMKGINVSLREIEQELVRRDYLDEHREVAPARPAPDVISIDTTHINANQVLAVLLEYVHSYF
jgi:CMP/dCMP kinase